MITVTIHTQSSLFVGSTFNYCPFPTNLEILLVQTWVLIDIGHNQWTNTQCKLSYKTIHYNFIQQ